MTKKICIPLIFILITNFTFSQNPETVHRFRVFLSDKNNVSFNPLVYFDAKAIERRAAQNLPLFTESDLPVRQDYIDILSENCTEITTISRWFNLIYLDATENQIQNIKKLPFVQNIEPVYWTSLPAGKSYDTYLTDSELKLLAKQTERMQASVFKKHGINGQGIRIAVFDAGFPSVNTSPIFKHIRDENRILKTYDFAKKKENVYTANTHGTMVLSCIAGMNDSIPMGLATQAEFLLARTEVETEPFSEEENWLAAAEWADKNGAQIINSSLGYTYNRYFTWEMDGKTSYVVRAANLAASKGILVVNAMGNDGSHEWKILGTPADADSILSVGGINPETDFHESFASFGPTADKRMKPNVSAYSTAIVAEKSKLEKAQGTSFSTPLVTGFAACAWQANNNKTAMQMFNEIQKSGDLFPYFDYAHGYGVPQASYFFSKNISHDKNPTFQFKQISDTLHIVVDINLITKTGNANNYLFYKISNKNGEILKYYLVDVYQEDAVKIPFSEIEDNVISASYKGFTKEITLK